MYTFYSAHREHEYHTGDRRIPRFFFSPTLYDYIEFFFLRSLLFIYSRPYQKKILILIFINYCVSNIICPSGPCENVKTNFSATHERRDIQVYCKCLLCTPANGDRKCCCSHAPEYFRSLRARLYRFVVSTVIRMIMHFTYTFKQYVYVLYMYTV